MTLLAATSFLLPGNAAWRKLGEADALDFADYGAWAQSLTAAPAGTAVVLVIFLADLLAEGGDQAAARLAPLLAALDVRLGRARAPTLVGFAAGRDESPMRGLRRPAPFDRALRFLADALYERAAAAPGLFVLPLDPELARVGVDRAYDARNFYAARCRLSSAGLGIVAGAIAAALGRATRPPRKVLVLDCDGTLWGGVIGEAGIGGIVLGLDGLGQAFRDFQATARQLAADGVLLALVSKNNESEVWDVFDRHPGMALARTDIVAWRINWSEKADNIAGLAADLDLGLDAFVFWDDNPLERAKVQALLPQVLTVDPPPDVTAWPQALARLDDLARSEVTAEDRRKTGQYRARAAFIGDRAKSAAEADFLHTIAMRPTALALDETTLPRATQLIAKTNQFNLRAARHDAAALAGFAADARAVAFLTRLTDRYGDHGLIGFVLVRIGEDPAVAFLDSFLMSCRVLGRHVEAWALGVAIRRLRAQGARFLLAEFIDSGRNAVAASFLPGHGFVAEDAWDGAMRQAGEGFGPAAPTAGRYILPLETATIPYQEFFADADAS